MAIPIGQLDKRITLQRPVTGAGALGDPRPAWQTVATVWAMVDDLRGDELERAKRIEARASTVLVFEYLPAVRPDWRAVWTEKEGAAAARTIVFHFVEVRDWHQRHVQLRVAAYSVDAEAP